MYRFEHFKCILIDNQTNTVPPRSNVLRSIKKQKFNPAKITFFIKPNLTERLFKKFHSLNGNLLAILVLIKY